MGNRGQFHSAFDFLDSTSSDNVSEDYQPEEIAREAEVTDDTSDESENWAHTTKWFQEFFRSITHATEADDTWPWPNSNRTQIEKGLGCSKTRDVTSMASDNTALVLQQITYVGGLNYARNRLGEATASRASGKGKQMRPTCSVKRHKCQDWMLWVME